MVRGKKVIGIVPARGGSKGIPRKNIVPLGGKPLIAWTIEAALQAGSLDRLIVSTDDQEIAKVAAQCGGEVPFLRPSEIAQDDTSDFPVYRHTLNWLKQNEGAGFDVVVWLRPTTPLRAAKDINNAIRILLGTDADWVRSMCRVEHHPYWMYKISRGAASLFHQRGDMTKHYRRQNLPRLYRLNGLVEATWARNILNDEYLYKGKIVPYVVPLERSVDIDGMMDIRLAEVLLAGGQA